MPELTTYLIPATQLFFFIVLAIVWLIGFIRKRNFGFLLLAFVTLAEGALSVARQGFINYLVFHSGSNVTNTQQTLQLFTTTTLIVYVFLWILAIVAAILIVLQRPKPPIAPGGPPVWDNHPNTGKKLQPSINTQRVGYFWGHRASRLFKCSAPYTIYRRRHPLELQPVMQRPSDSAPRRLPPITNH